MAVDIEKAVRVLPIKEYNPFLAMIFRMKYISRWSLMFNRQSENLSEHTLECAFITHLLAVIGNKYFNGNYNPDKLVVYALFHDASEILTGDLPTPVKYYNEELKTSYKELEKTAAKKLLDYLPSDLQVEYQDFLLSDGLCDDERLLLKTADKFCAYIKAQQEVLSGNKEFIAAANKIKADLDKSNSPESSFFTTHCLPAFFMSLDDLKGVL